VAISTRSGARVMAPLTTLTGMVAGTRFLGTTLRMVCKSVHSTSLCRGVRNLYRIFPLYSLSELNSADICLCSCCREGIRDWSKPASFFHCTSFGR